MKDFFNNVENEIIKNTKELSRRNSLLEALDALRQDYGKVSHVGLEKLQQYKEGFAQNLPESVYKGKPIGGALKEVKNIAARKAREVIYKYVGEDGKRAYIDYGNLKAIEEAGRKSIDQLRSKGVSKQAWEFIMDKAVTPITTTLGQVLYRTGEGLELIGKRGAKKVRDIVKEVE